MKKYYYSKNEQEHGPCSKGTIFSLFPPSTEDVWIREEKTSEWTSLADFFVFNQNKTSSKIFNVLSKYQGAIIIILLVFSLSLMGYLTTTISEYNTQSKQAYKLHSTSLRQVVKISDQMAVKSQELSHSSLQVANQCATDITTAAKLQQKTTQEWLKTLTTSINLLLENKKQYEYTIIPYVCYNTANADTTLKNYKQDIIENIESIMNAGNEYVGPIAPMYAGDKIYGWHIMTRKEKPKSK